MNTVSRNRMVMLAGAMVAALAGVTLTGAVASADPIALTNPSFEADDVADPGGYVLGATGWLADYNVYTVDAANSRFAGTSGNNPGTIPGGDSTQYLQMLGGRSAYQDVGTFTAGKVYTLTAAVGQMLGGEGFAPTVLYLLNQSNVIHASHVVNPADVVLGTLTDFHVQFTATTSGTARIYLQTAGNSSMWSAIDNVRLTESDPLSADAHGGYAVASGGDVQLNGSASGGIASYSYAWDLDGDTLFDDATGATPILTYSYLTAVLGLAPGDHTIAVRVTDGTGAPLVATDTATLNIAVPEPATMAFLAIGGLAMMGGAIRRRTA
ncbi:MAG: PEP-CTERM sorting domain-containing protein [Phycisphaerae bacterium]|nr:PEP-CTERM sorting domain-containing protein [Phycisphaerae bacterium]